MPDFEANDDIVLPGSVPAGAREEAEYLTPLVRRVRDLAFRHPRARRVHSARIAVSPLARRRRPARRACHRDGKVWAVGAFSRPQGRMRARCHPRHPSPGTLS